MQNAYDQMIMYMAGTSSIWHCSFSKKLEDERSQAGWSGISATILVLLLDGSYLVIAIGLDSSRMFFSTTDINNFRI